MRDRWEKKLPSYQWESQSHQERENMPSTENQIEKFKIEITLDWLTVYSCDARWFHHLHLHVHFCSMSTDFSLNLPVIESHNHILWTFTLFTTECTRFESSPCPLFALDYWAILNFRRITNFPTLLSSLDSQYISNKVDTNSPWLPFRH